MGVPLPIATMITRLHKAWHAGFRGRAGRASRSASINAFCVEDSGLDEPRTWIHPVCAIMSNIIARTGWSRCSADSVCLRACCYLHHSPPRLHTWPRTHTTPLHATTLHCHLSPPTAEPTTARLAIFGLARSTLLLVLARTLRWRTRVLRTRGRRTRTYQTSHRHRVLWFMRCHSTHMATHVRARSVVTLGRRSGPSCPLAAVAESSAQNHVARVCECSHACVRICVCLYMCVCACVQ